VRKGVSFIDRYGVGDTIAGVDNETSSSSGGIKRENSLNGDIESWYVETFKED